jgi:hypothetical protein
MLLCQGLLYMLKESYDLKNLMRNVSGEKMNTLRCSLLHYLIMHNSQSLLHHAHSHLSMIQSALFCAA